MLDKKEFLKICMMVSDMFGKKLSGPALELYYDVLKNYSNEEVSRAFSQVVKTHKYETFPKPAQIIEAIEGSTQDKGLIAWQQVLEAMQKADYYKSVEFKDGAIADCINHLGGWMWLCEQDADSLRFVEKDFCRIYENISKRSDGKSKKLIGFYEQQNCKAGFYGDIPPTVMIGFEGITEKIEYKKEDKPINITPETPEQTKAREEFFKMSKKLAQGKVGG